MCVELARVEAVGELERDPDEGASSEPGGERKATQSRVGSDIRYQGRDDSPEEKLRVGIPDRGDPR